MFWSFIYNGSVNGLDLFVEINLHIFPLIFLFIEMILNFYTYRLWLYIFPGVIGTIYLLINLTYSLTYKPVYKILTW